MATQETKPLKFDAEGRMVVNLSDGTNIRFRKPKGRDVRAVEKMSQGAESQVEVAISLMCLLSGQSEEFFLELDGEDLLEAIDAVSSFRVFTRKA